MTAGKQITGTKLQNSKSKTIHSVILSFRARPGIQVFLDYATGCRIKSGMTDRHQSVFYFSPSPKVLVIETLEFGICLIFACPPSFWRGACYLGFMLSHDGQGRG
jgi:hypothetical protein